MAHLWLVAYVLASLRVFIFADRLLLLTRRRLWIGRQRLADELR